MFVCLSAAFDSKTNDPKVFKFGIEVQVYPRTGTVLGSKVKGQDHRVNKYIFLTNIQSITQKRMVTMCSNLTLGMTLGCPTSGMALG